MNLMFIFLALFFSKILLNTPIKRIILMLDLAFEQFLLLLIDSLLIDNLKLVEELIPLIPKY